MPGESKSATQADLLPQPVKPAAPPAFTPSAADEHELRRIQRRLLTRTLAVAEDMWHGGAILIENKARMAHGGWLPWLRRVGIAERTAQRWMRFRREHPTIRDALNHVDPPSESPKALPSPAPAEQLELAPTLAEELRAAQRALRELNAEVLDLRAKLATAEARLAELDGVDMR